jgi:hypothetical protein
MKYYRRFVVRSFTILVCLLFSFSVLAEKNKHHHQPSVFEVTPLNSPVKESTAKFQLKLPAGFEVDKIQVKLKDAQDIFDRKTPKLENVSIANNIFSVSVSKLPPGFYRLYVKVWDKKNKGEHDFKTKFHDYVRFVIDESLQVPMPDSEKNNATVAGIDSDGDGIRDDIQRYINENFSSDPKIKMGARQYAKDQQMTLLSVNDKNASILATRKKLDSLDCLGYVAKDQMTRISKKLEGQLYNTKDRLYARIKVSQNFNGQSFMLPETIEDEKALCDFNPDIF